MKTNNPKKTTARSLALESLIALERDGRYSNLEINSARVASSLEGADRGQDKYMSCFNGIVSGYAALPETEPQQSLARQSKQVLKDFNFSIHDSYGAESDKILQMGQNLQPLQAFLTEIGAWQWYLKAAEQAQLVNQYLLERAKTKGQFVKGEMKAARRQTDLAIADLYKTINAMMELMPSAELTALYTQLKGLERYARQYYLNDTPGGGDEPTPVTPDNQSGQPETGGNTGTVTPVQPETGGSEGSSTGEGPQPGGDDLGNGDEN